MGGGYMLTSSSAAETLATRIVSGLKDEAALMAMGDQMPVATAAVVKGYRWQ